MDALRHMKGSCAVLCLVAVAGVVDADDAAQPAVQRVRHGISQLAGGQWQEALQTFTRALDDSPQPDVAARARCGAAQALAQLDRHDEALRYFQAAIDTPGQQVLRVPSVHLAAAASALRIADADVALEHLEHCLGDDADSATRRSARLMLVQTYLAAGTVVHAWQEFLSIDSELADVPPQLPTLALNIGLQAYRNQQPQAAREALQWYLEHLDPALQPDADAFAVLAWMDADEAAHPGRAATIFETFAEQHPKSYRANAALLAAANHRIAQENFAAAIRDATLVLENSVATEEELDQALWVRAMHDADATKAIESVDRLLPRLDDGARRDEIAERLIELALHSGPEAQFAAAVDSILSLKHPEPVVRLLDGVAASGDESRVANLVDRVFEASQGESRHSDHGDAEPAVESGDTLAAVCRWLAETSRHQIVGLKLEELSESEPESFSAATELWIAENLMQMGRNEAAAARLKRITVDRLPTDLRFHLALRTAELAVESADGDVAQAKLEVLRQQSSSDHQSHQAAILEAKYLFRNAQFDAARDKLEGVVRQSRSGELQGRGQWLIGESWFMQRDYVKAIDAYRTAESLGRQTIWRWLALLQAGKCFEALERPPEAVACYTALLAAEAPAAYRQAAATRLATLSPQTLQR